MKAFRALTGSMLLLAALIGLFSGAPLAQAAPAHRFAVSEMSKVILPETSIDGPGFTSGDFTFEGQTTTRAVIAWAGTDAAHHLNVMTSVDGLHYAHKLTLNELSQMRPAVAQMSPAAGGAVILAWVGTDARHTLNVLFDAYGSRQKLTLWGETSASPPALLLFNAKLYLAWTGTDAHHSLNMAQVNISSLGRGPKTILTQFSSGSGPTLGATAQSIALCWTTPARRLNLASSTDGVHFASALGSDGLVQTSPYAPTFMYHQREGGPSYWLAWTGTDPASTLNLQWTQHYPLWPDLAHTRTFTPESALGVPTVVFNLGIVVAWTGTDSAHHLNVARFDGQ